MMTCLCGPQQHLGRLLLQRVGRESKFPRLLQFANPAWLSLQRTGRLFTAEANPRDNAAVDSSPTSSECADLASTSVEVSSELFVDEFQSLPEIIETNNVPV